MNAVLAPPKAFAPLLASQFDEKKVDWSNVWASPKMDGIRCIIINGEVRSRKLKLIPNEFVQHRFGGRQELEGYDGELIVGDVCAPDVYRMTDSGVMTKKGEPDVALYAFDHVESPNDEYHRRQQRVLEQQHVVKTASHPIETMAGLLSLEEHYLEMGYEGLMGRAFHGPASWYKYGRATATQGTLWKLKRLEDFEAQIIGFEEELFNGNEATKDELGRTKRSSHAENKVGKNTMGKMLLRTADGVDFRCGIFKGYNAAWKKHVWENQSLFIGRWVKLQKLLIGEKDKPRHPRMIGFRDPIDF